MSDDNECVKCGGYSGGASLCLVCEKTAVKRNARKPRRKKLDPLGAEMFTLLKRIRANEGLIAGLYDVGGEIDNLLDRVEARFKV